MNERIKSLAVQLGPVATIGNWGRVTWADNVYPQLHDKMYAAIDLEKFAELIIKECASQVRFTDLLKCNDDSDGEILLQASVQLKQHFGVNG